MFYTKINAYYYKTIKILVIILYNVMQLVITYAKSLER